MRDTELIFNEISQIQKQYGVEVKRRAWPKSLKDRVAELKRNRLTYKKITAQTGISYFTIKNRSKANRQQDGFHSLAVADSRSVRAATMTVPAATHFYESNVQPAAATMTGPEASEG